MIPKLEIYLNKYDIELKNIFQMVYEAIAVRRQKLDDDFSQKRAGATGHFSRFEAASDNYMLREGGGGGIVYWGGEGRVYLILIKIILLRYERYKNENS